MKSVQPYVNAFDNISCQSQNKNSHNKTIETIDSRDKLIDRILTTNDTIQVDDH